MQQFGNKRIAVLIVVLTTFLAGCPSKCGSTSLSPSVASLAVNSGDQQTGTVGTSLPLPLVVTALDSTGHPVAAAIVSFDPSDGGVAASTQTVTTDAQGRGQVMLTLGTKIGTFVSGASSNHSSITFSATAHAGAGAQLVFVTSPALTPPGAWLQPFPQVLEQDTFGNPTTGGEPITLALDNNPSGATLGGPTIVSVDGGTATFPGVSVDDGGQGFTLIASAVGMTSGISDSFNVGAIPAADGIGHLNDAGLMDFSLRDGGAGDNSFSFTDGVALDATHHRLFVADRGNNRILIFQLSTNNDWSGDGGSRVATTVLGQPDFQSTGESTTQNGLFVPSGIAYDDPHERLFVAEVGNNRVVAYDVHAPTNGEPASLVLGQSDFTSSAVAATQTGMFEPHGVVYDAKNDRLYVAEYGNNRILEFDGPKLDAGAPAQHVLGQPNFTSFAPDAGINSPTDVATGVTSNLLFVADHINNRVLVFDTTTLADGMNATVVLGQPSLDSTVPSTSARGLRGPVGLAVDSNRSRLYVSDARNNRIVAYDLSTLSTGVPLVRYVGQASLSASSPGLSATQLYLPYGIAVDPSQGALFIGDSANNRVLLFSNP